MVGESSKSSDLREIVSREVITYYPEVAKAMSNYIVDKSNKQIIDLSNSQIKEFAKLYLSTEFVKPLETPTQDYLINRFLSETLAKERELNRHDGHSWEDTHNNRMGILGSIKKSERRMDKYETYLRKLTKFSH